MLVLVLERIAQLAPTVGGFLFTQVEHEGGMAGFDLEAVRRAVAAAGDARVTAAGGITAAEEISELDRIGADAQVGMALYAGRLSLGSAVAAPLRSGEGGDPPRWPTVVCDELGQTLGLVWSTAESLAHAVAERRGIYWSRSRGAVWVKGETSGSRQELLRVDLDCDRDALRFTVRQRGRGFCHLARRSCWPSDFGLGDLERVVAERGRSADAASGTARLLNDPALLGAKLREEAAELSAAVTAAVAGAETARALPPKAPADQADAPICAEVVHEAADLLYLTVVALARAGVPLAEVVRELERRHRRVTRRPMAAK